MTRKEQNRANYLKRREKLGAEWFRQRNRESYQKNRDKTLRRGRWRYYQHRDKVIARTSAYHKANPEIGIKAREKYAARHPHRAKEIWVKSAIRNRLKRNESRLKHYWKNREAILKKNAIARNQDRERFRNYDRDFRKKNRIRAAQLSRSAKHRRGADAIAKAAMQAVKRRAWQSSRTIDVKAVEEFIRNVKASEKINCFWCGDSIAGVETHIDHIIALAKGGLHSVENLCASCPTCNRRKGSKSIEDWLKYKSEVLYK